MDISELQWHLKQEKQDLIKAQENLDYAYTINKRLKTDIDFNRDHSPLVEEKLRLEQEAMIEIKKEQEIQNSALRIAKAKLKVGEEKFERDSAKILAEKDRHESRSAAVTEKLNGLKYDLELKKQEVINHNKKIKDTKQLIIEQENEINRLKQESVQMKKREQSGISTIEQLKNEIKKIETNSIDLKMQKLKLKSEIKLNHLNYNSQIDSLYSKREQLQKQLDQATVERNDLKIQNEDSKQRQAIVKGNIQKLVKENNFKEKKLKEVQKESRDLSNKIQKLENQNCELMQMNERKERQYQQEEDNLRLTLDQTRNEIEEAIKSRNVNRQRLEAESVALTDQTQNYLDTKTKMTKHIRDLENDLSCATAELEQIQNEQLFVAEELQINIDEFDARKALNDDRTADFTSILTNLQEENNLKEKINLKLQKKLNDLVEHQLLLENRTSVSIEDQNRLKIKTEEIDEEIIERNRYLGLVENDFKIQLNANRIQSDRLDKTKELNSKRKKEFKLIFEKEENDLSKAETNLNREILLNIELSKRYKVLQAQQIKTKDILAGFYEARVGLEDTRMWFDRILAMEKKYFVATSKHYILRDEKHKAEYNDLRKAAAEHVKKVTLIEETLKEGFNQLSDFLNCVNSGVHNIKRERRKSMHVPLNTFM